ncbi:MAG: hypothetical protein RJA70_3370, partial [Pseudomonadota bacterium]
MDPLVRVAIGAQRILAQGAALALSLGTAGVLVFEYSRGRLSMLSWGLLALLGLSALRRVHLRYRVLHPVAPLRREAELGTHLAVLSYALIGSLPGGFEGPLQGLAYVLAMWSAAFLARPALAATLTLTCLLEVLLCLYATDLDTSAIAVRVALLGVFAGLNLLVFRSEIARVRRLSHEKVESELARMREAARSFRLLDSGRSAADLGSSPSSSRADDEERMVHSSVDHLQLTLRFMLELLRSSCGLKTAALLWLDDRGARLYLREASSAVTQLLNGPFSAKDGLFAAALETKRPITLSGEKAKARMPLYAEPQDIECVCAIPLVAGGSTVGVLLADLERGSQLDERVKAMLMDAARFILRSVENERSFLQLERSKSDQGKLYRAADLLAAARSEEEVIRAGVESARLFARFDFAAVTLHHRSNNTHEICAVSGEGADDLVGTVFGHNTGLVSMVVQNRHALPYRGILQKSHVLFQPGLKTPEMPSAIVLPLMVHNNALGALLLGSSTPFAFSEDVRPLLEVLARHLAVSLANARMMKRLEELATTDGLTGLLNKRALTETARQKILSAKRFNRPISLIIGDIDHFKRVNDNYGHDVGDQVIRGFGDVLHRGKRETDSVGRFGGEEFVLVCEETDAAGAELVAERIRQELQAKEFATPQGTLQVTCSLGVATFPVAGTDWESLFKATDEALYVSKRQGRNQVSVWSPA